MERAATRYADKVGLEDIRRVLRDLTEDFPPHKYPGVWTFLSRGSQIPNPEMAVLKTAIHVSLVLRYAFYLATDGWSEALGIADRLERAVAISNAMTWLVFLNVALPYAVWERMTLQLEEDVSALAKSTSEQLPLLMPKEEEPEEDVEEDES